MQFHVVSLFKGASSSYLKESIIARALKNRLIGISFYNPREFSKDKFRRVDGRPYGGGPGMVMQIQPILDAVKKAAQGKSKTKVIIFSPAGKQFTNEYARALAKRYKHIVLV